MHGNSFNFTASWATNATVVIQAATSLSPPDWTPIATNALSNGVFNFADPQWSNFPQRYYRVGTP